MHPRAPTLRHHTVDGISTAAFLTYSAVRSTLHPLPAEQTVTLPANITIPADPLRKVPRGNFTLADYSYDDSDLCHAHFANCELANLGAKA